MSDLYNPPPLARHVGSWAIIETETDKCVCELFRDSKAIHHLNTSRYHAVPIDQHLAAINARIREGESVS